MKATYFDKKGNQFIPSNLSITDHQEYFNGAFLNMDTTIFSEDDNGVNSHESALDSWHDVRYDDNMSVFMDNENMSIYLRLDDCENGKKKFVSVTLDENEINQLMNFMQTVTSLKVNEK